jgi:hypothetical protein
VREDALDEQRTLIDLIESEGWDVTEADVSVYDSPWEDAGSTEATVTITARKPFPGGDDENGDDAGDGGDGDGAGDDDNLYRVN